MGDVYDVYEGSTVISNSMVQSLEIPKIICLWTTCTIVLTLTDIFNQIDAS